jgi:hypothetical protein
MPSQDDVFYVVGFTREDILAGALRSLTSLSFKALEETGRLHQRLGRLAIAAERGVVVKNTIEIYFESLFDAKQGRNPRNEYGDEYQTVQFLNVTAMRLCAEFGIGLPGVIRTIRRNQLPAQHGTTIYNWSYSPA